MAQKERYGYAVARLRALENRLLDESVLQRMIDSDTLEAALKVLGETPYSAAIMELRSPLDFDKAIENELLRSYGEAATFVPDSGLMELLRLQYDVHNVKVLVKSQILLASGEKRHLELMTKLGNIDTDKLILAVEGEEYWELPYGFDSAIPASIAAWDTNEHLLATEKTLDDAYMKALLELAESLGVESVTEWVRCRIDGENLKTLLRLSRIDIERSLIPTYLHAGGNIPVNRLVPLITEPVENWGRLLAYTDIGALLQPFGEGEDFSTLLVQYEKALDNFLTGVIGRSRYDAFSPANVVRYLWLKEIEAKNLRVILVSVSNGMERDEIRGLLRNVH